MKLLKLPYIFKRTALPLLLLAFITFLAISVTYAAAPKKYGEIKSDQALVYFIRPSIWENGTWLYADDQFLTYVKDKTYSFAYVKPGKHLIWLTLDWRVTGYELEFVPGQVYYIKTGYELSYLNETTGPALIDKMKRFSNPEDYRPKGERKNVNLNYSKALAMEAQKKKAVLPEPTVSVAPAPEEPTIKIKPYTPIKLKFCENISSAKNHTGNQIHLEVAEDVYYNQQLCFRRGTPAKAIINWAKPQGFLWKQGLLDLKILAVPAADNTEIPTIGQLLLTGGSPSPGKQIGTCFLSLIICDKLYDQFSNKDETGTTPFGLGLGSEYVGLALLKGGSAVILKGQEITVWTRGENWIKPVITGKL